MPRCPYCNNTLDISIVKSLTGSEIREMIAAIDDSRLNADNHDFIQRLKERLEKYGDRTTVTVPQRIYLKQLMRRYPAIKADREPTPQIPFEATDEDIPF